jgi:NodT family efflux transporter outer membrane factor (OMF) lipoprotein
MNCFGSFQILFLMLILLNLASCSKWQSKPLYPVPAQALAQASDAAKEGPGFEESDIPQDWWNLFNDPQLSDFISQALAQNPSIQTAQAQIRYASATADRVRAALFPTLFWNADVSRQKLSETGVVPFGAPSPATGGLTPGVPIPPGGQIPVYFTLYETEFNLSYNFDFWNKNKNTFRAALGDIQAKIAEEAFVRLQLSYHVAQTYFRLQTDYKRQEVAQLLVDSRTKYRDLIQKRIHANIDTSLSLQNAEYYLTQAKQALLQIQGDIAITENLLRALIAGDFEESIQNTQILDQPLPNVPLPCDLPLHLIARRPDITSQLWVIESAGRQIDVARAGFCPDFNLTAFYGYQTIHFRELFKWPSAYFNVDPAVSLPIFDGGRLIANLKGSEIQYDLAILKYNDLIINATNEVLDGIAQLRNNRDLLKVSQEAVAVQENLFNLTNLRVLHHVDTGLSKLLSEGTYLISKDEEIVAEGKTIQAMLLLIKALGGGYDTGCN